MPRHAIGDDKTLMPSVPGNAGDTSPSHLPGDQGYVSEATDPFSDVDVEISLRRRLPEAAEQGDLARVRDLIRHGANLNAEDATGCTALYRAAYNGHDEVVKLLIDTTGCDVNSHSRLTGHTALSLAAEDGNLAIVRLLLQEDSINVEGGESAACRVPIVLAVLNGHVRVVEALLKRGADPNVLSNKWTPLHIAAKKGDVAVVRALLNDKRCNPSAITDDDDSPVVFAARAGKLAAVQLLLPALHSDSDRENLQIPKAIVAASIRGHHRVAIRLQARSKVIAALPADLAGKIFAQELNRAALSTACAASTHPLGIRKRKRGAAGASQTRKVT